LPEIQTKKDKPGMLITKWKTHYFEFRYSPFYSNNLYSDLGLKINPGHI
jgi:hypothetical protein